MTTQATNVPAGLKLLRRWPNGFFRSNLWVKVVAGLIILVVWQVGVGAFAPRFVAKPLGIIAAIPSVLGDPDFRAAVASTLGAVVEGLLMY